MARTILRTFGIVVSLVASHPAQAGWVLRFEEKSRQHFAIDVRQTTDRGYIVLDNAGASATLIRLSPDARLRWARSYGAFGDDGRSVQHAEDAGFILVGRSRRGAFAIRVRDDGLPVWGRIYGGPGDSVSSVERTRDGGYILAGYRFREHESREPLVVRLRNDGAVDWARIYAGLEDQEAIFAQQTRKGGYVVGVAFGGRLSPSGQDMVIMKLRPNGKVEWQKLYHGSISGGHPLQEADDGGFHIAGTTLTGPSPYNTDLLLLKLRSDGSIEWRQILGGPLADCGSSIRSTKDGGYIVEGSFTDPCGEVIGEDPSRCFKVWVLKLNGAGEVLWQRTYGGIDEEDYSHSIEQTYDGGFVVAGSLQIFGFETLLDGWILKLDPDGSIPRIGPSGTLSSACNFAGEAAFAAKSALLPATDYNLDAVSTTLKVQDWRDIPVENRPLSLEMLCGMGPLVRPALPSNTTAASPTAPKIAIR